MKNLFVARLHPFLAILPLLPLIFISSSAKSQVASTDPASGISPNLMRVQPLDNSTPTALFMGVWEPMLGGGSWLSFDLDFTTAADPLDLLEARVTYRDDTGAAVANATVGPDELALAVLKQMDATTGTSRAPAFDKTGGTVTDFGSIASQCIHDLEIDSMGFIVAGGTGVFSPPLEFGSRPHGSLIARYTTTGELHSSFDEDGKNNVTFEHPFDSSAEFHHGINAIAIDPLLQIWTVGYAILDDFPDDGEATSRWALSHLEFSGELDEAVGAKVLGSTTDGGRLFDALFHNGRLIAVGTLGELGSIGTQDQQTVAAIAAFDLAGEIDPSFGLKTATFLPDDTVSAFTAVAIDSADRIYATGWFGLPDPDIPDPEPDDIIHEDRTWFVVRYLQSGIVDETFGIAGLSEIDFVGFDRGYPKAIAIDGSGRIVTVGTVEVGQGIGSQNAAISRLLPTGQPDPTFQPLQPGVGQLVTDGGASPISAGGVAVDGDDRIIVSLGPSLLRLVSDDGSLDPSFGDQGRAFLHHPDTNDNFGGTSIVVDGSRILVGGCSGDNFAVVRLLEDGRLDSDGNSIPPNSRIILAFPDEALPDETRVMPLPDPLPTTVDVELDVGPSDADGVWTLSWVDIPVLDQPGKTFLNGSYIFPLAPTQVNVSLPDDATCQAANTATPEAPKLRYGISQAHELRFEDNYSGHRNLVQSINGPNASNDQRFAYDFVVEDQSGHRYLQTDSDCLPTSEITNASSYIWGQSVVAIADGDIVNIDTAQPDNPEPGTKTPDIPRGGNTITIDHRNGQYSRYSHLMANSVPKKFAEISSCSGMDVCTVKQGEVLGLVGNSGNSTGPHLHFALMDGADADQDEGRPISFNNTLVGGMIQTNVGFHTGTIFSGILPQSSKIQLNTPSSSGAIWEVENNDSLESHQALSLPATVTGSISSLENPTLAVRGDPIEDIYRFEVKTRAQLKIELVAESDGVNLDVYLLNDGLQMLNLDRAGWGPTSNETVSMVVPPGHYYVGVSEAENFPGSDYKLIVDARPFAWKYAAKVVCGEQSNPGDGRLTVGTYATTVNIHHPGGTPAFLSKQLALAFPPDEQQPGQTLDIGEDSLGYDQAVKTDCGDILETALSPQNLGENTYFEGFVVIQSTEKLTVSAVYTSADLTDGRGQRSIDVETVPELGLGVDLQISKSLLRPEEIDKQSQLGQRLIALQDSLTEDVWHNFFVYQIEIGNLGPATATDVRVVDILELRSEDNVGVLIDESAFEFPPGGKLIGLESLSPLRSTRAEISVGGIAPGTTKTLRLAAVAVGIALIETPQGSVQNTATIQAGEAELLQDDNTVQITTLF